MKLEVTDPARGHVVREAFLGKARRAGRGQMRAILLHMPFAAGAVVLRFFAADPDLAARATATLLVLGRRMAALALLAQGWRCLPETLLTRQAIPERARLQGRLRRMLGQGALRRGEAPPYRAWIAQFDSWGQAERAAMAGSHARLAVVLSAAPDRPPDLAYLSRQSIAAQWVAPCRVITASCLQDCATPEAEWSLLLAPGEILADHAIACFAHAASSATGALGFYADTDKLRDGARAEPLFKPATPDPWLLESGLLTRGACLFHRSVLPSAPGHAEAGAGAETWRLVLAKSLPPGALRAISLVLTHESEAALSAPGPPAQSRWSIKDRNEYPSVTIVIPSSCSSAHVRACLTRLVEMTDYPSFDILLAVSSIDPANAAQAANLHQLKRIPRLRLHVLDVPRFNYAAVNNAASQAATGELLLLLNDDVVPIAADWLRLMVAALAPDQGAGADIVGARLLYGDRRVQHAGVIMGLGNLCEHAFRLSEAGDFGPYGIAALDRQVSAVTAACMLMRRALYRSLGGFDEAYEVALNDVDFCLRAGEIGARIRFAAGIELFHYESLSLGRHYQGERAALEATEVNRLRQRWAGMIAADPFYNPQASTELGREFQPAFPPRQTGLSWIAAERLARR